MSKLSPPRLRRRLLWAIVPVVLVHIASPLARADQLRLDALVQEGDLILEEAVTLTPSDEQLAQEEQQLVASEKTLRDEVQALNQNITRFNAAMAEHNNEVQAFQKKCGKPAADKALEDACDARGAQLGEQVNLLEEERAQLRARQEELNARVDKQNAWARDYAKRKGAQNSRDKLNQRDAEDWMGRAKQFFASPDFSALLEQAGNPSACGADQINEIGTLSARLALERAQACLKAIKEGAR
jgi:cell division protein FtsB